MKDNLPRYTLRIDGQLLNKLHYVAAYDCRSVNRQLEMLIKRCVNEFEGLHGEITDEQIQSLYSGEN